MKKAYFNTLLAVAVFSFVILVVNLACAETAKWITELKPENVDVNYTNHTFIPGDAVQTSDSGQFVAGNFRGVSDSEHQKLFAMKIDQYGRIVWSNYYNLPDTKTYVINSCIETTEGGYLLFGGRSWYEAYSYIGNGLVLKLDSDGTLLGAYELADVYEFKSVKQTADGGYVAAADRMYSDEPVVVKFDSALQVEWQSLIDDSSAHIVGSDCLFVAPDGYLLATRYAVLKLDLSGDVVWKKDYRIGYSSRQMYCYGLFAVDSAVIIQGTHKSYRTYATIVKVDTDGEHVWTNARYWNSYNIGAVTEHSDSTLIFNGRSFRNSASEYPIWISRIDSDGTTLWVKKLDDSVDFVLGSMSIAGGSFHAIGQKIGHNVLHVHADIETGSVSDGCDSLTGLESVDKNLAAMSTTYQRIVRDHTDLTIVTVGSTTTWVALGFTEEVFLVDKISLCDYQPTLSVEFDQSQGFFVQGEVGGITAIDCGDGNNECSATVPAGTEVSLTAVALPGYVFDYWDTGTVCHYGNPLTVTVGEDMTYTAVFRQLDFRLPMESGKSWLLTVEIGGNYLYGGVNNYHTGFSYYSLDFADVIYEGIHLEGVDVPILSSERGMVVESGYNNSYGYTVTIDHDFPYDGTGICTRYAHLKERSSFSINEWIERGVVLGVMGKSGDTTDAIHLHLQFYYDGDSSEGIAELETVKMERLTLGQYVVGSYTPWNPNWYSSTNE